MVCTTPRLHHKFPSNASPPAPCSPQQKKTGRFPAFRNTIKTSCLFFHPSRNELPPRGLPTSRKSLKRTGEERAALAAWRRKGETWGRSPLLQKVSPSPSKSFSLSYAFTGRGPKMSVPTRTRVAPSSTACTQSPDIPIESSGSLMPRRASRSSRSSRSRAK